jgi:hypothetical protein
MAGTIAADTLTHSTAGSLTTDYVVNGSAKAWVNLNGTGTPAARDSLNLSSITDYYTGYYGITLSSTMANANYSIQANATWQVGISASTNINIGADSGETPTASLYRVRAYRTNDNASYDPVYVLSDVKGDLA